MENYTVETLYHLDLGDSSMFSYNFNFWVYCKYAKSLFIVLGRCLYDEAHIPAMAESQENFEQGRSQYSFRKQIAAITMPLSRNSKPAKWLKFCNPQV